MSRKPAEKEFERSLADSGRLIEAGWVSLRVAAIPLDVSETQLAEMRKAFMAGAAHLFSSIMHALEPGDEPTERDLRRLDLINRELTAFNEELQLEIGTKHKPGRG